MPDTTEAIENRLGQIFREINLGPIDPVELSSDTALVGDRRVIDSVALLEFVVQIENGFSIILDDGSLKTEHFETIGSLAKLIQTKIDQAERP